MAAFVRTGAKVSSNQSGKDISELGEGMNRKAINQADVVNADVVVPASAVVCTNSRCRQDGIGHLLMGCFP